MFQYTTEEIELRLNGTMTQTIEVLVKDGLLSEEAAATFLSEHFVTIIYKKTLMDRIKELLFGAEDPTTEGMAKIVKIKG